MKTTLRHRNLGVHRRGATLVLAVVMMFMLVGMLAFSIDTGYFAQTRAEASRAADSASLAGCWEVYQQLESNPSLHVPGIHGLVAATANNYSMQNSINESGPSLHPADIQVGYLSQMRGAAISSDSSLPFVGVRVKLHKDESKNGSVPFFFGRIFGHESKDLSVESTAVMSKAISGFYSPGASGSNLDVLPFALDQSTWISMLAASASGSGGQDNYSFSPSTGQVTNGSDGILEINLFPQGTGSPGNRGTVDIGGANNSTNDIARQIVHGISSSDLVALGKPLQLDLGSGTMTLNGDTGISAGVKDELQSIVGQKRIIPIFSNVSGNGNNATYTITKWVGVRIMHVKLTGSMNSKRVMVQPAPIVAPQAIRSAEISTSDYIYTPVVLSQ